MGGGGLHGRGRRRAAAGLGTTAGQVRSNDLVRNDRFGEGLGGRIRERSREWGGDRLRGGNGRALQHRQSPLDGTANLVGERKGIFGLGGATGFVQTVVGEGEQLVLLGGRALAVVVVGGAADGDGGLEEAEVGADGDLAGVAVDGVAAVVLDDEGLVEGGGGAGEGEECGSDVLHGGGERGRRCPNECEASEVVRMR